MDIDHHDQKHCCKFCAKCFPCGRSLGGHMRSHLPSPPPPPPPPHSSTKTKSYVLRDKPKKSCRLASSSPSSSIEECFNPCYYSSEVVEEEQEEDDVALILMMLSRDTASSSWIGGLNHESSDKNSIVFEDNARDYDVSDNEYNSLTHTKKRKSLYRYRYQCRACSKSFDTYQALGGHRASHKRADKGSKKKMIESVECPVLKKVKKQHQCGICLKVFSSGQALGGHKRSHIAAIATNTATTTTTSNTDTDTEVVHHQKELDSSPLMSELLDLNLPAAAANDDDDDDVHESWGNGSLE